ncbi:MAG: ComEA family DNA-binding protein [Myxococcota bacterium]
MNPVSWRSLHQIGNVFAILILGLLVLGVAGQAGAESKRPLLDLNRATSAQLEALPGIGEKKAAAILAVRDARGGFKTMDQLESVRGIGPALMTKLRPLVEIGKPVGNPAAAASKSLPKSSAK